MLTRKW